MSDHPYQQGRDPPHHHQQAHAPRAPPQPEIDLDTVLFQLSDCPEDSLTTRQACEGFFITGEIGSGKTSGSGQALANALLQAEGGVYGGLVLCAKPEERGLWEDYCKKNGRLQDLLIIEEGGPYRFNPLDYTVRKQTRGGGMTENIVHLLQTIIELVEGKVSSGQGEQFWDRASNTQLRNGVELLILAQGSLTLDDICRFIQDAPRDSTQVGDPEWQKTSFCAQIINQAQDNIRTVEQQQGFRVATDFWLKSWPDLGEKTRSSIEMTFLSAADMLLHGPIWSLFGTDTTIIPECSFRDGKIILIDLPIQSYHQIAVMASSMFAYCWKRAILERDVTQFPRPAFLWADEAQNFISSFDYQYQAVARSARAITVYLTQNLDNFIAKLGGSQALSETNSFVSNLTNRIAHTNRNYATNNALVEGSQEWVTTASYSTGQGLVGGQQASASGNQQLAPRLLHRDFQTLAKGGPPHWYTEAIVLQGGRVFKASGDPWLKCRFPQR